MRLLGISAYFHDSAAAMVCDGRIVAAAQEERFSRKKYDAAFPAQAIGYCLREAHAGLADVDAVVFHEKPFLHFERLLETYVACAPRGIRSFVRSMPLWLRQKLFLRSALARELRRFDAAFDGSRLLFSEHHLSHAASAFFASPFEEAAVLTMDGVGEWATTSAAVGTGSALRILKEIHFPHSLGLLYSAFTAYLGFEVNSGEYKVMGLAPYGEPRYAASILGHLVDVKPDGSFRLDMEYFDYLAGLAMTSPRFDALFGGPPRRRDEEISQRHRDLAASIQCVTEDVVLRLTRSIASETRSRNLCLAGGVALNCVANGRVLRDGAFERLWIQPAAGDAGGALGAALAACHLHFGQPRVMASPDIMGGALLGPAYTQQEIEERLRMAGARFEVIPESDLLDSCARDLAEGKVLGWFQGRMEFGPRALGGRSILADPRVAAMKETLNVKVKRRESFRPFAPSVPGEEASRWFDLDVDSPYMLLVAPVASESLPAVTHVDGSARVQTVARTTHPLYHELLTRFGRLTGCPVLVNTSFNMDEEPIVCTPEDAFACFMKAGIDVLAIGRCRLERKDQPLG